jgi:hypothetical protein
MRSILWTLLVWFTLSGCSVAVNSHDRAGSASAVTASTQAQIRTGHGSAGLSFGSPAPSGAPGGHASLSRGASAALILALVVADVVHYFTSAPAPAIARAPAGSIAETCSCYGYQPPVVEPSAGLRGENAMP